jgi:hypothetical protein
MLVPIDIFKLEAADKVIWMATADNVQAATAKIAELMKVSPCDYLISNTETHRTLLVRPDGQITNR